MLHSRRGFATTVATRETLETTRFLIIPPSTPSSFSALLLTFPTLRLRGRIICLVVSFLQTLSSRDTVLLCSTYESLARLMSASSDASEHSKAEELCLQVSCLFCSAQKRGASSGKQDRGRAQREQLKVSSKAPHAVCYYYCTCAWVSRVVGWTPLAVVRRIGGQC